MCLSKATRAKIAPHAIVWKIPEIRANSALLGGFGQAQAATRKFVLNCSILFHFYAFPIV